MEHLRLHRAKHRPVPLLPVIGEMALMPGRAHEICGPARRSLALEVAARTKGPVIWIRPAWQAERLNPEGLAPPSLASRLIFVDAKRAEDLLWCLEESLRAGTVALAVAELPGPPPLTPVRRLHLAAEAGTEVHGQAPLGLLLTPGAGGAAGVESRWSLTPTHGAEGLSWRLDRLRARTAPQAAWQLEDLPTASAPLL